MFLSIEKYPCCNSRRTAFQTRRGEANFEKFPVAPRLGTLQWESISPYEWPFSIFTLQDFHPIYCKEHEHNLRSSGLQVSREDISQRGELKKIFSKMFNFMLKSPWFAPTWSHPCLFDPECTPDASGNCTPYHRQLSRASKSIGRTTPMLMVPSPTSLLSAEFLETPLKGQAWQEEETNTLIGAG